MARAAIKWIYKFDELSDSAKERAREWWRGCIDSNDFEFVIEDAVRIGEMFGIEFSTHSVKLMGGGVRRDPDIWWSLSYSQGDGACFEGSYRYKAGCLKAVKEYAPQDEKLHRIVARLVEAQKRNFYQLTASIRHSGHYSHSGCASISIERYDEKEMTSDAEGVIIDELRSFMDWIYDRLREENDYLTSDEQIDEAIRANEYEFDEFGDIA